MPNLATKVHLVFLLGVFLLSSIAVGDVPAQCPVSLRALMHQLRKEPKFHSKAKQWAEWYRGLRDIRRNESTAPFFERFEALSGERQLAVAAGFMRAAEGERQGFLVRALELSDQTDVASLDRLMNVLMHYGAKYDDLVTEKAGTSARAGDIAGAAVAFKNSPSEALDHIWRGDVRIDTSNGNRPVIAYGMHSVEAFQSFLNRRADYRKNADPEFKQSLETAATLYQKLMDEPVPAGPPDWAIRAYEQDIKAAEAFGPAFVERAQRHGKAELAQMPRVLSMNPIQQSAQRYSDLGFRTSGSDLVPFLLLRDEYISISSEPNKVVRVRLPRNSFRGQAWDQSRVAAQGGLVPLGGKTLFPPHWTEDDVKRAVESILSDADSALLDKKKAGSTTKMFYVVGEHQGVRIAVGIVDGEVKTAFPTWRQQTHTTTTAVYAEYGEAMDQMQSIARQLNNTGEFSSQITKDHLRQIYLKKDSASTGLPDADVALLKQLLSPAEWIAALGVPEAFRYNGLSPPSLQRRVAEWIAADRLVRDTESAFMDPSTTVLSAP